MIRIVRDISVASLFLLLCVWIASASTQPNARESILSQSATAAARISMQATFASAAARRRTRSSRKSGRMLLADAAAATPVDVPAPTPIDPPGPAPTDSTGSISALAQTIANLKAQNNPALESTLRRLGSEYFYLQQRAYPNDKVDWSAYEGAVAQRDAMPIAVLSPMLPTTPVPTGGGLITPVGPFPQPVPMGLPGPAPQPVPGLQTGSSVSDLASPIASETRGRAMQTFTVPSSDSFAPGAAWQFIGPTNDLPPFHHQFGNGPVSGRVNAIAYDPSPGHSSWIYVGAADGGLWRSTDNGFTWTPLGDSFPFMQVSSIAVDPNGTTIYVGGGDFDDRFVGYSAGLLRSTDAGSTWTNIGPAVFKQFAISKILIDPDNPQVIMVATGRGASYWGDIWRGLSDNFGNVTFTDVLQIGTGNNIGCVWRNIVASAMDSGGNRRYYAAGYDRMGTRHVFYTPSQSSTSRGSTWIDRTFGTSTPYADISLIDVAASPTNPNVAYAMVGSLNKIYATSNPDIS